MALTESKMAELGMPAPDFNLPATDGKTYSLDDFANTKGLLVVFTCNHCPYAQAVEDRLIALGKEFMPKGLGMVLICSNDAQTHPDDSFDNMQTRAERKGYPFPYLHDESQEVARAYMAACTPDPFLFDANGKLVYRGRIDDNWENPSQVSRQDLREAVEALLAGRPVDSDQKPSLGCNIKWK